MITGIEDSAITYKRTCMKMSTEMAKQQKIIDLQDEIIDRQIKFDYGITAIIGHIDPEIYNNKKAVEMIYKECCKLNKELAPLREKLKVLRDE